MTEITRNWDVIVIGAGHNGLTAGALLARAGRKVLIVERRALAGGVAAGEEFYPGYRTQGLLLDTSGVRRSVAKALRLQSHGLKFLDSEPPILIPQENGPGLVLPGDLGQDAKRYAEFRAFLDRVRPLVRRVLGDVPPSIMPGPSDLLKLLKTGLSLRLLGERDMLELLRIAPMCAADWLNEWFSNPLLKAALAAPALHGTYMGPWSAGTVATFLLRECSAEAPVEGGPAALVRALEAAAEDCGARLRLNAPVRAIRVKGGKVSGVALEDGSELSASVVVSSCDPKRTLLGLVSPADLPLEVERQIRVFKTRGTSAKVNLALKTPLEFSCRPGQSFSAVRTGENLDFLERAFDAVKYRRFSERPLLDIRTDGRVAELLVHFAPYDLAGGWTAERREALGDAAVAELVRYAPKAKESIIARQILTPADLEERYGLTGGHVYHGEHALDQFYSMRPSADLSRYATPVCGLFLGGGGSHPGGGITCAPGALAAKTVLRAS